MTSITDIDLAVSFAGIVKLKVTSSWVTDFIDRDLDTPSLTYGPKSLDTYVSNDTPLNDREPFTAT